MKVLMLSWEFPPKIVGGIARHVYDLALALAKQQVEVSVITCGVQGAADYETIHGVKVYRVVMNNPSTPDFLTWVLQLNLNMAEMANRLALLGATFDIIHAHDWLSAFAGKNLKHSWRIPLVSTIHATEYGRNNGLHNDLQRYISNVEWWLGYESWRVICCSQYMKAELQRVFQMPGDKIRIIPNGVYPADFEKTSLEPEMVRSRYCAPDESMIFYVGRIVREKGLGVLLDAFSRVLGIEPKAKLVIAGKGPYLDELKHRAYQLGIYHRVYFAGYIDDDTRNALYKSASVAVFPSLYEPFGIVALEGMAAGAPVIASDAGGLGEIIHHGDNGLKVYCDNVNSLADNIIWALQHPDHCGKMKANALKDIQKTYNWDKIATQTSKVYQEIVAENRESTWHAVMHEEAAREIIMSNMIKTIEAEEMTRYRDVH
jgi:glycogen(starch) synthase